MFRLPPSSAFCATSVGIFDATVALTEMGGANGAGEILGAVERLLTVASSGQISAPSSVAGPLAAFVASVTSLVERVRAGPSSDAMIMEILSTMREIDPIMTSVVEPVERACPEIAVKYSVSGGF